MKSKSIRLIWMPVAVSMIFLLAGNAFAAGPNNKIIHDAEYYISAAQNDPEA